MRQEHNEGHPAPAPGHSGTGEQGPDQVAPGRHSDLAVSVYQPKVTLLDTKPPTWQRIFVDCSTALDGLHEVIQAVFGWWNCHLHEFEIGGDRYGVPDPDWDFASPTVDERTTRLDAVASEGASFLDFVGADLDPAAFDPSDSSLNLANVRNTKLGRVNFVRCTQLVARYHDTMTKNMTVRLPDELAADTEALARVEGKSVNETIKDALSAAIDQRRRDPKFKQRVRQIIDEDRELLERLAK